MLGRSLGMHLSGGMLALFLGSASGNPPVLSCISVSVVTFEPCPCETSKLTFTLLKDSGDICSALHYLLLLAFRGHVIEAHEERPSEADVRVSSGIRVSGRGDLCEIEGDIPAISTFVVTLNTCDVFPGDQLVEKFVLADDNLPEDISTLIPGLLGTEKVPYCPVVCTPGDDMCGDPHMQGLRGQKIDWSGVDGGWYSLLRDPHADFHVNVRLTAPLSDEFPDRQLVTGLSVMSEGHSLVIAVENPYAIDTDGCPEGHSPCLADGGLRIVVDGEEANEILSFSRQVPVADGALSVSASNLPAQCRQFGGDRIWARMYQEMLEGRRQLAGGESLEDWILRFDHMAAPDWCAKYIAENDLADLQSNHAIFKIDTPTVTVRLNAGVNYQGEGELDWDGRALPDLEFWQLDVGMDGLDVQNPVLSGILGETARPVYDKNGKAVMEGFEAFRGTVEDYRVSGPLGTHFSLLDDDNESHK